MPSRARAAAVNVRAAMRTAGAEFELKDLARTFDGYSATFQRGLVSHVESGIDEAVVEDQPPPPALYGLIRKVQGVFAGGADNAEADHRDVDPAGDDSPDELPHRRARRAIRLLTDLL
jgi:hypothetical protein